MIDYETAKHLLECSHCIGTSRGYYFMPCEILKNIGDGRLKIKVFGDRNWKDHKNKSRIRYVESHRVYER